MAEIQIVPLEKSHIDGILKIESECFSTPFKKEDIEILLDSKISGAIVAVSDGAVLGYISYTFIIDECQIINVAVSMGARRMGVGSKLMSELISQTREKGAVRFMLEVRETNGAAIALYEKFNFIPVGVSKNHFSSPRENAILMNLEV